MDFVWSRDTRGGGGWISAFSAVSVSAFSLFNVPILRCDSNPRRLRSYGAGSKKVGTPGGM